MLKRILGLLGWLGVALVFAAVAIRFLEAGVAAVLQRPGDRRPGLHAALHPQPVARDRPGVRRAAGAVRHARGRQRPRRARASSSRSTTSSTRHNKRWDLTAAQQFSLSDQTQKVLQDLKEPVQIRVFARSDEFQRFRDRLDEYTYQSKQVSAEYIDPEKKPGAGAAVGVTALGTVVFEYKGRNEKVNVGRRAGADQRADQGRSRAGSRRSTSPRATARRTRPAPTAAATTASPSALTSGNFVVDKVVLAQQTAVPGGRRRAGHRRAEDRFPRARDRHA